MITAVAESPLTALVWVFAVCAGVVAILIIITLLLAIRHQRRRSKGVYAEILAKTPSSHLLDVLTVSDLIMDERLRKQIQPTLLEEAKQPEQPTERKPPEGETH
jgi:hypothetical protein